MSCTILLIELSSARFAVILLSAGVRRVGAGDLALPRATSPYMGTFSRREPPRPGGGPSAARDAGVGRVPAAGAPSSGRRSQTRGRRRGWAPRAQRASPAAAGPACCPAERTEWAPGISSAFP